MPNIVLIGCRGGGKSSTAEELSHKLGCAAIHTDTEIERKVGPIAAFVRKNGWAAFRDEEEKAIFKAFANWAEFELNFGNERSALLHIGIDEKLTNLAQRIEAWRTMPSEHHKAIKRESRFHHKSTV